MMFPTHPIFVGIDLTTAPRSFTYAVLDGSLNLISLNSASLQTLTALLITHPTLSVALNAPPTPNQGLAGNLPQRHLPASFQNPRVELRLAELQLRQRGILVSKTPARLELCPPWMQAGFALHRTLQDAGFKPHPAPEAPRQLIEVNPHAGFCALAGQVPLAHASLEGRLQRQLLLYDRGLRIPDPMDFFEEITRYKLIKGILPHHLLFQPRQLDALLAAYTAWLSCTSQGGTCMVGDALEGQLTLPVPLLKDKYQALTASASES